MQDHVFSRANKNADGAREMEDPPFVLPWLAGWAAMIGFCAIVWLTLYKLAVFLAHLF
jgi:hypothetical protein